MLTGPLKSDKLGLMSKKNRRNRLQSQVKNTESTFTGDSFVNFVGRLGINPSAPQNVLSRGHYNFNLLTRNRLQLEQAYRGSWVVGQVVDSFAEDMTRAGINIQTSEGADNVREMQAGLSRLSIWNSLNTLVKWGRLYGGAIAVIQVRGQDLATPLDFDSIQKGDFVGLSVYDRWQLNPDLKDVILQGPDMGLPQYYYIVVGNSAEPAEPDPYNATGQIKVHHSRCIRMIGIELPFFQAITEMMWGESVIERLWDRLISFDETSLSVASLVDRAQLRTVQIDGLRNIIAMGGKAKDGLLEMFEMIRAFQTNEGLTLLDKDDTFSATSYSFAGLSDVLLQFGQQIAGASGIPLVRLFGQSPAGLSATGDADIRMYYDNIHTQQEARMRNPMEKILKVLYRSLFGLPMPDDLQFTFAPLWQMSELDRATITKTNAETIIATRQEGLIDSAKALSILRETSGDDGMFASITDPEIAEAELNDTIEAVPQPGETTVQSGGASAEAPAPSAAEEIPEEVVPNLDEKTETRVFERVKNWLMKGSDS